MGNIHDIFLDSNPVNDITDKDYQGIYFLINAAKAFSRNIHNGIYIIDYFKQNFLYVSENMTYWYGLSSAEIQKMGHNFYLKYIPENEQKTLLEINKKGFDLFNEIPISERLDYSISYDFHIIHGKELKLINQHYTPIALTRKGHIWLALCIISISTNNSSNCIVTNKSNSTSYYEYSLEKHKWIKKEHAAIKELERNILILSSQGYTMDEIADKLCKSTDTIKACKKILFAKFEVRNIIEALHYAINHNLL